MTQVIMMVWSFTQSQISWSEVKWALRSIMMNKAIGGQGIPVELFQILKDDAVKVLHLVCQQIWKTQQWPQDWKRSVFFLIPKKGNAKECSNYRTTELINHASNIMLKYTSSQASTVHKPRTSRCTSWIQKRQRNQKLPTSTRSQKKQGNSRRTSTSASLTTLKPLTVWITTNCGKFFK